MMGTPVPLGKKSQMSESLKARLKRCGRSYKSPVSNKQPNTSPSQITRTPSGRNICSEDFKTPTRRASPNELRENTLVLTTGSTEPRPKRFKADDRSPVTRDTSCETYLSPGGTHGTKCKRLSDNENSPMVENSKSATVHILEKSDPDLQNSSLADTSDTDRMGDRDNKSDQCQQEQGTSSSSAALMARKTQLLQLIAAKQERLRKLKMVKMYRSKNNLEELEKLITRWREVSQEALVRLQGLARDPRPSLTQLINHLQIDHDMLCFSTEDESFS